MVLCRSAAATSRLRMKSCGIEATYHVNVTLSDGHSCNGTLSDIDDVSCMSKPAITLTLQQCPSRHTVLGQSAPAPRVIVPAS